MAAISFLRPNFGPPAPDPAAAPPPSTATPVMDGLAGYIRDCYENAARNRQNLGVDERMMAAMRALRGEYDPGTLKDIREFGGSEIYARVIASKVRGCAALLREIYVSVDRPWALSPTPEPDLVGPSLNEAVQERLMAEAMELVAATGQSPDPMMMRARMDQLREELTELRKKSATDALRTRESSIDDVLWEGGFYEALWAFLGDIATFPFGVIKGPVVRFKNTLVWGEDGVPTTERRPHPSWERCSPFDVYFAPWASTPQDGYIVHRERVGRAAIESLRGLPNYNTEQIDALLAEWPTTSCEWYDSNESERAALEQRESDHSPFYSGNAAERPLSMLSFYGRITRQHLIDWGMDEGQLPADSPDVSVFAYLVGSRVIGVTLNPHPTGRLPFYTDSFERVPGSCYGNAIPDILEDIQSFGNAALRSLVNNLAIASGPMAWINEDRLYENDPNATKLWPWKVFRFNDSMSGGAAEEPMKFFQPTANVEQLFMVYERALNMADELSTIPRYMQGSGTGVGGAGRTASGLAMLMEASNRTIKQTVSSIDTNVIEMVVEDLNVFLALTRPDVVVAGDISVVARGAVELMQRETLRMRRLEFLNITNNPVDQQLVGIEGRFHVLREIARDLGMPVSDTIPLTPQQVEQIQQMMLQQSMMALSGQGMTGNQTPAEGQGGANPTEGVARPQANNPGE